MSSDLSFNIVALDRASSTFVKVAEQLDQVSARLDRLDGKTATVDVNVKSDQATSAMNTFTGRFNALAAGIVAGSPAIGAAIVAGVGAGFIAVAALAQKSNQDVQQTYKNLWNNVTQDTKAATDGLVPVIVAAGNQMGAAWDRLGPLMAQGFAAAGPEIVSLTRGVTDLAENAMPGLVSMVERGQSVFTSLAGVAGQLGTAIGDAFASIGSHADQYGLALTSFGSIVSTVLGLAVTLMNDVAQVWASVGPQLSQALQGVANVAQGLASGAMPVLSAALSAAANIIIGLSDVLAPLSGVLGFVATAALATWAAFKGASLITAGIKALAPAALSVAASMDGLAGKAKTASVAMNESHSVASSLASSVGNAAGAASKASFSFATMAESLGGGVGIAIAAVTIGLGLLASAGDDSAKSAQDLKSAEDSLTSALEQSDGAIDNQVVKTLQSQQSFKDAADAAKQFGISQQQLIDAVTQGGPALDALKTKLQAIIDAGTHHVNAGRSGMITELDDTGNAAKTALDDLNALAGGFQTSAQAAAANKAAVQAHTQELLNSPAAYTDVQEAASATGLSMDAVSAAFAQAGTAAGSTSNSVEDLANTFSKNALATANAEGQITSTFKQAQQQVTSASQAVADAQHGISQAAQGVADAHHAEAQAAQQVVQAEQSVAAAQHGVQQAQQSLKDAITGVSTAQYQYNQALQSEQDAEKALSDARQQAVRDIQAVHDALNNSITSQMNARLSLFNAQQAAAALGVNSGNAQQIANEPITTSNAAQVKAAIDLISAQNQLQQSTEALTNAKVDALKADQAGVNGSAGVISAQKSLVDAQHNVQTSLEAVTKAQLQVGDASFALQQAQQSLVRAQQGVSDAAYAQQKAHQAVTDAQYQQKKASEQLTTAQQNLATAQQATATSFDLSTDAGRRNLGLLNTLSDAVIAQFGPNQVGYTNLVIDTANAFGMSRDNAEALLKSLGKIPQDFKFSVTGVTQMDMTPLADWAKSTGYFAGGFETSSGRFAAATGGHIRGPGTETSDDIPAMLSDNEYVQRAAAVNYWGVGFMDDVNNLRMPRALKFASGGLVDQSVDMNLAVAGYGMGYEFARNAAIILGANPSAIPQIPAYTPPAPGSGGPSATGGAAPTNPAGVIALGQSMAAAMGWTGSEWNALYNLWMGESGWNPLIANGSSGAYGIPQSLPGSKMASAGADWRTNPATQIRWGLDYIKGRYGDPASAYGQWLGRHPHWYSGGGLVKALGAAANPAGAFDNGGQLMPGWTSVYNGTGKPENVRTASAEDALLKALQQVKSSIDSLASRPFNGTLRTSSGAFLGEVKAAFDELTTQAGSML